MSLEPVIAKVSIVEPLSPGWIAHVMTLEGGTR